MSKNVLFRRFLRNPVQVGALCPSSRALCSTMVSEIGVDTADVIVELGPGTGVITREIVRCMSPNAKLIAIELDQTLCEHLRKAFPEVTVCNDSAAGIGEILARLCLPNPVAVFRAALGEFFLPAAAEYSRCCGRAYRAGRLFYDIRLSAGIDVSERPALSPPAR